MNQSGDFSAWASCFPDDCLPLLFRSIVDEWPLFLRPGRTLENRITHNFVAHLQRTTRGKIPFGFHFRGKLTSEHAETEEGEVDIIVRAGVDPLVFFGFECKRLRVLGKDGSIRSEAGDYVGPGGMGCFLSGQYDGGGLSGGMIGYVMDGEVSMARGAVDDAIFLEKTTLNTHFPHRLSTVDPRFKCNGLEQTIHDFRELPFTIFHLLLPLISA